MDNIQQLFRKNQQLIIAVCIIVVVAIAIWFFSGSVMSVGAEGFEAEAEEIVGSMPVPAVDPTTGVMVDGPGFEQGEIEGTPEATLASIPANYYFLDDGAGGEMSIQHNLCSKSCCSEQWPTPHKLKHDPYVCGNKDKMYPSNYFCNNTFQDSGCLCLTKKQHDFLYNRGGNGREWF